MSELPNKIYLTEGNDLWFAEAESKTFDKGIKPVEYTRTDKWISVDKFVCQADFEYLCCCDDDVFMAIYREDDTGEWFELNNKAIEVQYIQELPEPPQDK